MSTFNVYARYLDAGAANGWSQIWFDECDSFDDGMRILLNPPAFTVVPGRAIALTGRMRANGPESTMALAKIWTDEDGEIATGFVHDDACTIPTERMPREPFNIRSGWDWVEFWNKTKDPTQLIGLAYSMGADERVGLAICLEAIREIIIPYRPILDGD